MDALSKMEYGTPTKTPRSLYNSPWRKDQFKYLKLDTSDGRLSSPPRFVMSRSWWRRYWKTIFTTIFSMTLVTFGFQNIELRPRYYAEHVHTTATDMNTQAVAAPSHTYAAPLIKPAWEDHPDEEHTPLPSLQPAPQHLEPISHDLDVDWSSNAYATYATNTEYLCNALMFFAQLTRFNTKAAKVLIYPSYWRLGVDDAIGRMLLKAKEGYGVTPSPVEVLEGEGQEATLKESYTKLLVWNLTEFKKVIYADCDGMVLKPLDDLFLLPLLGAPAALPRAYWEPTQPTYSSHFMVVRPDRALLEQRMIPLFNKNEKDKFDMDIVNTVVGPSSLVLPHRPLTLLSGEYFRTSDDHRKYLSLSKDMEVQWDAQVELEKAMTVHFSDWPIPKPWVMTSRMWVEQEAPVCKEMGDQVVGKQNETISRGKDCRDRQAWLWLREEFAKRRKDVCGADGGPGFPDLEFDSGAAGGERAKAWAMSETSNT